MTARRTSVRNRMFGVVAALMLGAVSFISVSPTRTAQAAGIIPPGAPSPQPTPQCPPPANLRDWFQPNCAYNWTFADPSVIMVPDDPNMGGATGYYAYGTNTGGSTLPVMWTRNPLTGPWVPRPAYTNNFNGDPYFNDALSAPYSVGGNQPPPWMMNEAPANSSGWGRKKLWAPGAIRLASNKYVVYFSGQDRPGHWCIGRATGSNPWGPFTAQTTASICSAPDGSPNGVLDPQPFQDANGQAYLIFKSEGVPGSKPTSIYSRKLDANGQLISGEAAKKLLSTSAAWQMSNPATKKGVIENPAMVRFKGRYYLFYSGNEWKTDNYGTGYATCSGPAGPCTEKSPSKPLFRSGPGYWGAGGATPFLTADGSLVVGFSAWNKPGGIAGGGTRLFHTMQLFANSSGAITFSDPAQDLKFVRAAYLDFLGKSPSSADANFWADRLSAGTSTRAQFLSQLANSSAWVGATVDRLYIDTLGRPPDSGGRTYWVNNITSGRFTVAGAAALFYSSDEYFRGFGRSNVRTWILDLYQKILLRSGSSDPAGVNYWVSQTQKHGRPSVAASFYQSSESRHTRVKTLYEKLLRRGPDRAGWDYWANQILRRGDITLAMDLASSSEYYRRAQTR